MNPGEISAIRTQLRDVNVEYSALVKNKSGEGRFMRMRELRAERAVLMAMLARDYVPAFRGSLRGMPEQPATIAAQLAT
jgi:hypothetical protein